MPKDMITEQVDLRKSIQEPELKAEEIVRRKFHLLGLGFQKERISLIMKEHPALYDPIAIDNHILGLRERGFSNPNKMIKSFHPISSLAFENIDSKLAGLKKRGFSNPNKIIESSPAILGYTFKNIDRHLKLLNRLIHLYHVQFTAQELMENQNALFGSKIDKLVVLTRVLKKFISNPQDVTNTTINRLLFSSLEDVLIAVDMVGARKNLTMNEFIKLVKEVKAAGLSRERKQKQIEQGLQNDPKIKSRYLKGYSSK